MTLKEFYNNLKKGKFLICKCTKCKATIWPPSQWCSNCIAKTRLEPIKQEGKLLEFTDSYMEKTTGIYGIVEVSDIKLIGLIHPGKKHLRIGMNLKLNECGISKEGHPYYHFTPLKEKT